MGINMVKFAVAVYVCFSNSNLTLFALLLLGNDAGEGEAPAAARNTDSLGAKRWLRDGGKVCPRVRFFKL